MDAFASPMTGNLDGPADPNNWKRGVYRQAPSNFTVEMLGSAKKGGNYSYGIRICGTRPEKRNSSPSVNSKSSRSSSSLEYEIWRRWEDCLIFQETLEREYGRLAYSKKQRLVQGKGVKKNGVYISSDQAASFESLPPGPEPSSVALDVHQLVPKLSKKGTLFKPSLALIEQRAKELAAVVEAIYADDAPTLLVELRETRLITDFFGYWRRDDDLAKKVKEQKAALSPPTSPNKNRSSVSSSVFSQYFYNSSSPSLADLPPSPRLPHSPSQSSLQSSLLSPLSPSLRSPSRSTTSTVRPPTIRPSSATPTPSRPSVPHLSDLSPRLTRRPSTPDSIRSREPTSAPATFGTQVEGMFLNRRPRLSTETSASSLSSGGPATPIIVTTTDLPIIFGHNPESPHQSQHYYPHRNAERPMSGLESLPEDSEVGQGKGEMQFSLEDLDLAPPARRPRPRIGSVNTGTSNRNAQIFEMVQSPTFRESGMSDIASMIDAPPNRQSWATMMSVDSGATFLEGLNFTSGSSFAGSRSSIASAAMTDCSADAILPLDRFNGSGSSEEWTDPEDDVMDAYFDEAFPSSARTSVASFNPRPQAPTPQDPEERAHAAYLASLCRPRHFINTSASTPQSAQFSPTLSTPTRSPVSPSSIRSPTSPAQGGSFSVKAAYGESIVGIRVGPNTTLSEVRQKLFDKLVGQEGMKLSPHFQMAIALPTPSPVDSKIAGTRARSGSLSSVGSQQVVIPISSEDDWEDAICGPAREAGKISLRILDSRQ